MARMAVKEIVITCEVKSRPAKCFTDSSYDVIVRELAFGLMVQRGLKDSDEGRTISNEEMKRRIKTWQK